MRHTRFKYLLTILLVYITARIHAFDESNLFNDLLVVDYWNKKIYDRMPVTYNNLLQGGYFNMPSARMGESGEIGVGYASVPPYGLYNLRCQLADFLELTGNYRIFHGVKDPILSQYGFGDLSDKGANIKVSVFRPEESRYQLPGLAFGFEDFMGTRNFKAKYVVLTKVFLDLNLEMSLGWGAQRIKGFFGGISWMPFRKQESEWVKGLSFVAEYDATPYKDKCIEKHPKGRTTKCPFNFGVKYRLWNHMDFSLSYVRGQKLSWAASTFYNFGHTKGVVPKFEDPMPYLAPINTQPMGEIRPEEVVVQDFLYALKDQGFELYSAHFSYDECGKSVLRMRVINSFYRAESHVRNRLNHLVAKLAPSDIDRIIFTLEGDDSQGMPIQEYRYDIPYVQMYSEGEIGCHELEILTPLHEVSYPDPVTSTVLFKKGRELYNFELFPKTHTIFGSSRGKFKYALGLSASLNGYLPGDVYYYTEIGFIFFSNLHDANDYDRLNPSQLINVRSDIIRYYKKKGVTFDKLYLQKNWNMGRGWFSKLSGGWFEEEYGGVGGELLYYPVNSNWAVGLDGAVLKKRKTSGLAFTSRIRKLKHFEPTYQPFVGSQCSLNLYYDWKTPGLLFKISPSKFLANDIGIRYEVSRYFPSGMKVSFWFTHTNGHDKINGQRYYDKGIAFSMPTDIFYTHSDRSRWGYGMSAWLRDVGVKAYTGEDLYMMVSEMRQ